MSATTEAAIRTQVASLIAAMVPTSSSSRRFVEHHYEQDFLLWIDKGTAEASFRRFSVRDELASSDPEVTNTDEEWRVVMLEVLVGYPRTFKYGKGGDRAMDEVMRQDLTKLERSIGLAGFQNISNAAYLPNRSLQPTVVELETARVLRMSLAYGFYRSIPT